VAEAGETSKHARTIFLVVAFYLIFVFLWRFIAPAHEYPSRMEQALAMALDLMALVALIGVRVQTARTYPDDDATRTMAAALFWIALLAGLGLLAIRLSSDAAWWTGHRVYYLLPR
jgi:hypothetical protein